MKLTKEERKQIAKALIHDANNLSFGELVDAYLYNDESLVEKFTISEGKMKIKFKDGSKIETDYE